MGDLHNQAGRHLPPLTVLYQPGTTWALATIAASRLGGVSIWKTGDLQAPHG